MVQYTCPICGNQFSTPSPVTHVRCPHCNQEFQVMNTQQSADSTPYGTPTGTPYGQPIPKNIGIFDEGPSGKSRGVAALLAFFLGAIGVHYFYVNKSTPGIIFLLVTLLTCGFGGAITGLISLIQAVLMITQPHEVFEQKWVNPANSFPIF